MNDIFFVRSELCQTKPSEKTTPSGAAVLDSADLDAAITEADVIIYATGAEVVVDRLRPGTPAIEYRHIPDPADIERVIVPLIRGAESNMTSLEREAS